jgi:hypothetical protein
MRMEASITTDKNSMVVVVLDAEAAHVTFACVIFAARFHEEIVPLAQIVEQQLRIVVDGNSEGDV